MNAGARVVVSATSTPLSSIFGSGFLIIVPILASAVGTYSVLAMALVCGLAYAVGGVIRYNIVHTEPILANNPSELTLSMERASDLALILAYVISVCLYLHILSAFVLGSIDADTELNENLLTTAVIAVITLIALTRGLETLAGLEKWALYVTLVIIVLLVAGFGHYDWTAWHSGAGIELFQAQAHTPWEVLTIVAGTLIVVQGFETTRYLGDEYDTVTRVRASRWSQIISTAVYLLFIAVAMPLVHTLDAQYDDNSLIKLAGTASVLLVAPLVVAAALSQFSAAVADTLAGTGNMEETTGHHLKAKFGAVLVAGGAIALTWSADTLEIVAIASRAFAFYYMLQCIVAISVAKSTGRRMAFGAIASALAFITIFAVPAS